MDHGDQAERASEEPPKVLERFFGFGGLSPGEFEWMKSIAGPEKTYRRGDIIRAENQQPPVPHLLVEGWASSAIVTSNGNRQLIAVNLPGDLLGLPALAVENAFDAIVALSAVTVREVRAQQLARMFEEQPRLAAILFLVSQDERARAMERLASMARTSAKERLASLFIRLRERIAPPDGEAANRIPCHLTQQDMADLIGVTAVHLNAVLGELKAEGLVSVDQRQLTIHDHENLRAVAGVFPWRSAAPDWLPERRA